jgi:tRNA(fMet)-specific endonuclease VapC
VSGARIPLSNAPPSRRCWNLSIEALDQSDIIHAARLRADLQTTGRPIGPYDLLIAGQALARDWTLVTTTTCEFSRIGGLKVIDGSPP